jgi:hypothetical protein
VGAHEEAGGVFDSKATQHWPAVCVWGLPVCGCLDF